MSQYPSPYQPPQPNPGYGYAPVTQDPLAPARHASILMLVLGGLVLLMAGCVGLVGAMLPKFIDKMPPEQTKMFQELENTAHISPTVLFTVMAVILAVFSLAYIVCGIFVRRGGLIWLVIGIVLTVLTILYLMLNAVGSLFQGAGGLGASCFSLLLLGLFGWLLILLIQATRASGKTRTMQAQYQAQYMQYQQMMQQYGQQAGYGYAYPPPPAPPPASNPPSGTGDNLPPPQ